jgi:hypothetical protein
MEDVSHVTLDAARPRAAAVRRVRVGPSRGAVGGRGAAVRSRRFALAPPCARAAQQCRAQTRLRADSDGMASSESLSAFHRTRPLSRRELTASVPADRQSVTQHPRIRVVHLASR